MVEHREEEQEGLVSEEADMGVTRNYSQIDVLPLPLMILDVEVNSCSSTFVLRVLTLHSPSVFFCVCFLPADEDGGVR